jgi:hypothetical protein
MSRKRQRCDDDVPAHVELAQLERPLSAAGRRACGAVSAALQRHGFALVTLSPEDAEVLERAHVSALQFFQGEDLAQKLETRVVCQQVRSRRPALTRSPWPNGRCVFAARGRPRAARVQRAVACEGAVPDSARAAAQSETRALWPRTPRCA